MSAEGGDPAAEGPAGTAADNLIGTPSGVPKSKYECSKCGILMMQRKAEHEAAHHGKRRFSCAVCGVFISNCVGRNNHEQKVHQYERVGADARVRGAVKISKTQLRKLINVGFKLAKVQAAAVASAASRTEDEATTEELVATMEKNPQDQRLICPVCKLHSHDRLNGERHLAAHRSDDSFVCSFCGIRKPNAHERNNHELRVHAFRRHANDERREAAIRLDWDQWTQYFEVGTNIEQVQADAVESLDNAQPEDLESSNADLRSLAPPRPVKTASSGEKRRHTIANPLQPAPPAQARQKRPAAAVVEVIQLDDSDDEQPQTAKKPNVGRRIVAGLPPPLVAASPSAPFPQLPTTPAAASSSTNNNPTAGEERSAVRLLTAFSSKPRLVYYDHKELSTVFESLPANWWAHARDSSLLLLRSSSPEWTGDIRLPPAVFRFSLSDQFGEVLCFAKPTAQKAASRLRKFVAAPRSFVELMAAVRQLDFPSALIVAGDVDGAAVRHKSSSKFFVL